MPHGVAKKQKQNQTAPLLGNSLAAQRLGLSTLTAEGPGSIPGRGTKVRPKRKKKRILYRNASLQHDC